LKNLKEVKVELSREFVVFMLSFGIMCAVSAVYFIQRKAALNDVWRQMNLLKLEVDPDLPPVLKFVALRIVLHLTVLYELIMIIGLCGIVSVVFTAWTAAPGILTFVNVILVAFFLLEMSPMVWSQAVSEEIDQRLKLAEFNKHKGYIKGIMSTDAAGGILTMLYKDCVREFRITESGLPTFKDWYLNNAVKPIVIFAKKVNEGDECETVMCWYPLEVKVIKQPQAQVSSDQGKSPVEMLEPH